MKKSKVLIVWDGDSCKRYILNESLNQVNKKETHYITAQFIGEELQ